MKFEEVKNKLRENPGSTYSAFLYEKDNHFFSRYLAAVDEDDLDWITIHHEGGQLFSTCGEEEVYGPGEYPKDVESLTFLEDAKPFCFMGYTSEYLAFKYFDGLINPDKLVSSVDKEQFSSELNVLIKELNNQP